MHCVYKHEPILAHCSFELQGLKLIIYCNWSRHSLKRCMFSFQYNFNFYEFCASILFSSCFPWCNHVYYLFFALCINSFIIEMTVHLTELYNKYSVLYSPKFASHWYQLLIIKGTIYPHMLVFYELCYMWLFDRILTFVILGVFCVTQYVTSITALKRISKSIIM